MTSNSLTVRIENGAFTAYVAFPAAGRGSGLLLIQEIFGVNADTRAIARSYAERGYVAAVPDLFWRFEPGIELDPNVESDVNTALDLYAKFDENDAVEDLKATLHAMHALPACSGKVACLGFCLGGKLAYLMATRSVADASVGYYGVGIEKALAEGSSVSKPLMLHLGEADPYVPPAAQVAIRNALAGNPLITVYAYPGCGHAFARPGGAHYDKAAAELADRRSAEFLSKHLG